ncbi:MAG: hypothetical protein JOZ69_18380 [Myxococcales bacterium]|nr:hypothetical protein [Myxococcales bacterium]
MPFPARSRSRGLVSLLAGAAALLPVRQACACGASTGGAAGVSSCSLEEHEEAMRRKWEAGVSYSFTSTALHFSDGHEFDEQRRATLAALDYQPTARTAIRAGAGVLAGGTLRAAAGRYDLAPGFVGVVGGSWRVVDASGAVPFVLLTAQLSYAGTSAASAAYDAFDLRAGTMVGTTLWRTLTPYVLGRAFGGPVYWRYGGAAVTGTDVHHYQVGGGIAVVVARRVDAFVEGVALGEQGLSFGLGVSL